MDFAKNKGTGRSRRSGKMRMRNRLLQTTLLLGCAGFLLVAGTARGDVFRPSAAVATGDGQSGQAAVKPATAPAAIAGAKVTFRRIFKSSVPEFIEIVVRQDSDAATYEMRQLDDEPGSSPFQVGPALRAKIFALAAQLNHFQGLDLDVRRKIANLGEKTFLWQDGAEVHETKFNYTLNARANELLQIFEGLARQEGHIATLTRRMRYDRLGIYDGLLQAESDYNHGLLPEPARLLPVLDKIAEDSRFVDVARQRARTLAERIRHSRPEE